MPEYYDVVVIGAGASGLMCAAQAGYRGRSVLVLEHTKRIGRKILMSGGGRCNFTNLHNSSTNFISHNPHFCKSALSRFSAQDFIELVERHGIAYHEKTQGQLFCDQSSRDIRDMLLTECEWAGVEIQTERAVTAVKQQQAGFELQTSTATVQASALVVATGGLSIPNGGATPFAYRLAEQFGLKVLPTRAALVPFTLQTSLLEPLQALSGVSHNARVRIDKTAFTDPILFTHRGLSGPAILQISTYWQPDKQVVIDLLPDFDLLNWLKQQRQEKPKADITTLLAAHMSKRMAQVLCQLWGFSGVVADMSNEVLDELTKAFKVWQVKPSGTEGYRTAEVTAGGIDTQEINQKTMASKKVAGLYFIGECLDVTGHLGGHNFQWAWASGYVAGQAV